MGMEIIIVYEWTLRVEHLFQFSHSLLYADRGQSKDIEN